MVAKGTEPRINDRTRTWPAKGDGYFYFWTGAGSRLAGSNREGPHARRSDFGALDL